MHQVPCGDGKTALRWDLVEQMLKVNDLVIEDVTFLHQSVWQVHLGVEVLHLPTPQSATKPVEGLIALDPRSNCGVMEGNPLGGPGPRLGFILHEGPQEPTVADLRGALADHRWRLATGLHRDLGPDWWGSKAPGGHLTFQACPPSHWPTR